MKFYVHRLAKGGGYLHDGITDEGELKDSLIARQIQAESTVNTGRRTLLGVFDYDGHPRQGHTIRIGHNTFSQNLFTLVIR